VLKKEDFTILFSSEREVKTEYVKYGVFLRKNARRYALG
jgi:hypothetical protein